MPVSKVSCPKCRAVLKPNKPLPVGKKVKCPKCAFLFTVKPGGAGVAAGAPQGKSKASPTPPPKKGHFDDEDDDGPATYSFASSGADEEASEEKEDITVVPDVAVKDPRGPATATLIRPSNWLMRLALIGCLTNVVLVLIFLIPQLLEVPPEDNPASQSSSGKDNKNEQEKIQQDRKNDRLGLSKPAFVGLIFGLHAFAFAYYAIIVFGVFKMQTLESYRWSVAACILGFIPLASALPPLVCWAVAEKDPDEGWILPYAGNFLSVFLASVICLVTLRKKEVIAGFEYRSDAG